MVICLEQVANDLHMVQLQLMPLPPHHLLLQQNPEWFFLLVPAYPACPGKKAVKCLCVCVLWQLVSVLSHAYFQLLNCFQSFTFIWCMWPVLCDILHRLVKNRDETNARVTKQAIEAKLPYLLQFLANADDDVSGTIAPFAHDYVTMLKQTVPLNDHQKEFVKVQIVRL